MFTGDLGFRVFKLDTSNLRAWEPERDNLDGSLIDNIDHVKADRSEQDVLCELLLKLGHDLSVPIQTQTIAGKFVRSIGAGTLIACLEEKIARERSSRWPSVSPTVTPNSNPAGDTHRDLPRQRLRR